MQESTNTGFLHFLFAVFMAFNWVNLFRARSFGKKNIGMLVGLSRNKLFILVAATIAITNTLIAQFGGSIFGAEALALNQRIVVYGITFGACDSC